MPTSIVAVKLTPTEHAALAELVRHGYYESYSAVLRAGLMMVLDAQKLKAETRMAIRMERLMHTMRKRRKQQEGDEGEE